MDFAERLRGVAVAAGHGTLVATFHALVEAVEAATETGVWEVSSGPFYGSWHHDAFNARLLSAHLGAQDLYLEHVDRRKDGSVHYVVSWSDKPDWDRLAAPKPHYTRPRREDDPLYQDFVARKRHAEEKKKQLAETDEFRQFVARKKEKQSQDGLLSRTRAERKALQESRARWKAAQRNLDAETTKEKAVKTQDSALIGKFVAPPPPDPTYRAADKTAVAAAVPQQDEVVAVLPRNFLTKAEFIKDKNALLDADFEQRLRRNAELLAQCKAGDLTGPVKAPGIKGIPVDLSDGSRSLCRCGQSAFYPFCDMSHVAVNKQHGTTFSPWRADAEAVGSDVIVVCGCGESKHRNSSGVLLCDQKSCQELPVVQQLRQLEETSVVAEPLKVSLQRSSHVFEQSMQKRRSTMTDVDGSYRDARRRWLEVLRQPLPSLSSTNAEESIGQVKRENVEIMKEEEQLRNEILSGLESSSIMAEELASTRAEVAQLCEERMLRLRTNLVPIRRASLKLLDDSETAFDTLFAELKTFVGFTRDRLEMQHLDFPGGLSQAALEAWESDAASVRCELHSKMDALERAGEEATRNGVDITAPLKTASSLRQTLLDTMEEIDDEVRGNAKRESAAEARSAAAAAAAAPTAAATEAAIARDRDLAEFDQICREFASLAKFTMQRIEMQYLEFPSLRDGPEALLAAFLADARTIDTTVISQYDEIDRRASDTSSLNHDDMAAPLKFAAMMRTELQRTIREVEEELKHKVEYAQQAHFDSDEEEKQALQKELDEQRQRDERQREAEAAERAAIAEQHRLEEIERVRAADARSAEEEHGRIEEVQRKQREEHEAAAERARIEEEERVKALEAKRAEEDRARQEQEKAEKQRQLETWLAEEKEKKRLAEEEEAQRAAAEAEKERARLLERQAEMAAEQQRRLAVEQEQREKALAELEQQRVKERQAFESREKERIELEKRVAEAERKKEDKKLAAKSPRRAAPEDSAQKQQLQRAALQREQAEKGAAAAQAGVQSLEKGELSNAVLKTRAIDTATPEVGRKAALPSAEDSMSPQTPAPGQEEVVNAPVVLRANYSGRTWSQMAAQKVPFCVRLLDVAKRRQDEPASKSKVGAEWVVVSWAKYALAVEKAAKALLALGLKRGEKVLILAETRHEWNVACLATQLVGGIVVSAYLSISAEALTALSQEQLPAVLVTDDASQWAKLRVSGSRVSHIKHIVALGAGIDDKRAIAWEDFLSRGADIRAGRVDGRISQISPSDTATISYSERSMRGYVLSHANEMFAADSLTKSYSMAESDRILAFMPLANAAERVLSMLQPINTGCLVYYGDTLANLHDNIGAVQPTVIFSAPILWEKFAAVIVAKLGSKDPSTLASSVVKKLRKFIGCSRLRIGISSLAAIQPQTITFYRALGLPVRAVYAKTALGGIATFNDGSNAESLGLPFEGVSFASEANTGELIVKGPNVCVSQYGASPYAGTLRTGDMVRITADRCIHFVGRVERQVQLQNGAKVNLDALELALHSHPLVAGAFAVHREGNAIGAILALNREVAKETASKLQMSVSEYLSSPAVAETIDKHVAAVNATLPAASRVRSYRLTPKEFSIKEGEVTSHMLVVPSVLQRKYANLINEL